MTQSLKDKISAKDKWLRLLFMVIFAVIVYFVALSLVWLVALCQFFYTLFTNKPNKTLQPFAASLSKYICQVMTFLTYTCEEKPFPFQSWPSSSCSCEAEKPAKRLAKESTKDKEKE
jgi:hypothetical protein